MATGEAHKDSGFTPEEFEKKTRGVTIVSEAVKEGIEIT